MTLISCESNKEITSSEANNEIATSNSNVKIIETNNEEIISELTAELSELKTENESLKNQNFDSSLLDSNIQSYQGLFWGSVEHGYSDYFKSMAQRVLFESDYIWIEEITHNATPIEEIRKTEDSKNQLLGIIFILPIKSTVTSFPENIIETWFNTNEEKNYLYIKTVDNKWYSYNILDGHLMGDYRILSLLLTLVDEINNSPA